MDIRLLNGGGYSRNISVGRLRDHIQIARKFALATADSAPPDVIVGALPTIELCDACVSYGVGRGIPVVLDMRDMWPDIFVDTVPRPLRPVGRLLLRPWFKQAHRACSGATAIIGITEEFVDWGVRRGGRRRGPLDRAFPITYQASAPPADKLAEAESYWDDLGIRKGEPGFTVCYFGSIGAQLDLTHVIEAARILVQRGRQVRFVLCGRGQRLEEYRRQAQGLGSVILPGWVDRAQIWSLMRRSSVGLDPLPDRYDFLATINNKAVEYLSAGLPIVSSPRRGTLSDFLAREFCGWGYRDGSAEELAGAVERLYADPQTVEAMSRRARKAFEHHFTADAVHTRMTEYLVEVAASIRADTAA